MSPFHLIRGSLAFLLLCLNTAVISVPILTLALLKLILPLRPLRLFLTPILNQLVACWIDLNRLWLPPTRPPAVSIVETGSLARDEWYLVLCNHQSWSDIFIVQALLNRRIPQMKFFLKQELIWVPVVGLVWWALDFPFMRRYTRDYLKKHPEKIGKDFETTKKACDKFRHAPVAIFNFVEGTRFTPAKHRQQHSPYRHLLKPRAGGLGYVLSAMGEMIPNLLDITIRYAGPVPGFWDLLSGRVPPVTIELRAEALPAELRGRDYEKDHAFRSELQRWLTRCWQEKDERLSSWEAEDA